MKRPMDGGSDAVATFVWGLRRYAAVAIAMMLALGVLVPLALSQRAVVYQATAQLGPSEKIALPNTTPLPRFAESVFNNGAVEQEVRRLLNQPHGNVIPSRVQLIAAQDNVVLDVVATAPTASQAISTANDAAATFQVELSKYDRSVAPFLLQHKATFAKKQPKLAGGYASVALGLVAGLIAGVALVGLILVIRRPIVDPSNAREATGLPVLGRVSLPRHGAPTVADIASVGMLCRRLSASTGSTIHVVGARPGQAERLSELMRESFVRMREQRRPQKRDGSGQSKPAPVPKVVAPDGAEAWLTAADESTYTVLLTPEGISSRSLRRFAETHDPGGPRALVLLRTHRRKAAPAAGS